MLHLATQIRSKVLFPALAGGLLLAVTAPAIAQSGAATTTAPAGASVATMGLPDGNSPAEVQARQAANAEQARLARQQVERNKASEAEYARALKEVEDTKVRIASDQAAAQAAYEAETARLEREHAEAMTRWEADVAACRGGDSTRCAPPAPR